MDPRITASLTAFIGTLLVVKFPQLGESGATQAAGFIVAFVLGWITRTPGSTPPAGPDATFPAGQGGK